MEEEKIFESEGHRHLAGIIPINSQKMDFKFPWPDCMQPIAPDFLSIERAILECATAGCDTIWIACPLDIQPILRHRIGDSVQDPVCFQQGKYRKFNSNPRREITIYYIPVHPKDKNKRDSIVWNLLYGCTIVAKVSRSISKWVVPHRYYICFPNAVFPSQYVRKYRQRLRKDRRFLISYNDESILNGKYLSCTLSNSDVKFMIREFRKQATGIYSSNVMEDGMFPRETIPLEDRYSGRFITIGDIFSKLPKEEETKLNIKWYYDLTTWRGLCEYLGSEHSKIMRRPFLPFLHFKQYNGVASVFKDKRRKENKNESV